MMKMISTLIALILIPSAFAFGQIDDASRNLLIEKLDHVNMTLAGNDSSKVAVTLRLADLYAERARIDSMKELDQGCTVCNAGAADRKKALRYYTEVLDRAPEAVKGKVMVQVGHLYQLTGSEDKAVTFYQRLIQDKNQPDVQAEANLSLAEIYFKRREFSKAQPYYQTVLKNPTASSKGLAAYRLAWCEYNQGNLNAAVSQIEEVLRTPALLTRNGTNGTQIDPQFQDEVSRDLATFLSKKNLVKQDIEDLYKLSPETSRVQNVETLATEAERVGKKVEALQVWQFIYGYINKPEERLAAQISMAQLFYDQGDKKQALTSFETALQLWRDLKTCGTTQCDELRRRARQFVVSWNQTEKKQPTSELLTAYQQYLATFPDDIDMNLYAAEIAKDVKEYRASWNFYNKARLLLTQAPETTAAGNETTKKVAGKADAKTEVKTADKLEAVLLSQIDLGETSKDETIMNSAYDMYIQYSPKKTKLFEVQYQKAHGLYDKGQYPVAAEELRKIALTKNGDAKIRKQAADLSLDALVLMKDETRMEAWANDYAQNVGDSSNEFSQIAQKSILTKSANLASAPMAAGATADSSTMAAYDALLSFNVSKASPEDKIKFYKNKLILSEKLKKYSEALTASESLLAQPGLSAEDREFAWERKAYLAELTLDFGTALAAIEKTEKNMTPEQKTLKLAIFAELSGRQSAPYYSQYLQTSKDDENKKLVAAELVRKSKTPEKEIETYRPILEKSPPLMAELYSEAFAKTPSDAILKRVAKDDKLKGTDSGKQLARVTFLKTFAEFKKKLTSQQLDTKTDRKLVASIKARGALLDKLEADAKLAIQEGDWTSQLVTIDLLAKESERFYTELLSAPMPKGLSDEEQQQYLNLLSTQAAPYQTKASEAKVKVEQFWKSTTWLPALQTSWQQKPLRNLTIIEINALKEIAPPDVQTELAQFDINQKEPLAARPSVQAVQDARRKVHQDPMDKVALNELMDLEKKSDNVAMAQYLQTRIETLNKGVQ